MTLGLPPEITKDVDAFLKTKAARKLGIKSRNEFIRKLTIAFLVKYNKEYQQLESLFSLDDSDIKSATEGDLDL